jgi:hypothetical protein
MMSTLRGLRAIMWLRWRLLKNSLIGGRKRDEVEQMARALAMVVPFMIVALSMGTFLSVCAVGYVGGRMMANGLVSSQSGLLVVRLLAGLMAFTIIALSLVSPAQSTLSRYTRLLLLPIPRRVLHLVEVLASMGDPWVAVVTAGLTTFAIGLYAGGQPAVAFAALLAAILTVSTVVCAGALVSFLIAWLMRDRRRGELLTLVFVMGFSLMSFVPAFMARSRETRLEETRSPARPARSKIDVAEFDRNLPAWTHYLPSELHGRAVAAAFANDRTGVANSLAALLLESVLLFLASGRVHRQMLGAMEGDRGRRRKTAIKLAAYRFPGLSGGSSAVAWALIRNTFRSVRGRLTILLPGPMLGVLVAAFKGVPSDSWTVDAASRGYLLFGAGLIFTFYAMHAISMNLFGSDRAGLTLQLLVPVTDRELVRGKLVGFAAVIGAGGLACLVTATVVAHSGSPAYWLAVILGGVATFCLVAPLAIWCSALFPVANDLSKTGSAGNPHPFAMVAGTLATALLFLPTVVILALAEFVFRSPLSAVAMAAGWVLVAAAIGFPLVKLAARAVSSRRENLALVAQNK